VFPPASETVTPLPAVSVPWKWQFAHVDSPGAPENPVGGGLVAIIVAGSRKPAISVRFRKRFWRLAQPECGNEKIAAICATTRAQLRPVLLQRASIPINIVRSPFLIQISSDFRKAIDQRPPVSLRKHSSVSLSVTLSPMVC